MTRERPPSATKEARGKKAHASLDRQKGSAIVSAVAREELVKARKDFTATQLQRRKEAAESKFHLYALCHPLVVHPGSEWHPLVLTPAQPNVFFKIVAAKDGQLLSVLDGGSSFSLRKWTLCKHGGASWPPVTACFLAYKTPMEAIHAKCASYSKLARAAKMLIRVEAKGYAYHHESSGAWALSQVKPVDLLTQFSDTTPLDVHYALNPVASPATELTTLTPPPAYSPRGQQGPPAAAAAPAATWPGQQGGQQSPHLARRSLSPSPRARPLPPLLAAVIPGDPSPPRTQWSPRVRPEALMAERTDARAAPPSPPRPPFIPAAYGGGDSPARALSPAGHQHLHPHLLPAAGYRPGQQGSGSPRREGVGPARGGGAGRPAVAGPPLWYVQSVPERGAEGFAARFNDNRPLNQRVNVAAGIERLYQDASKYAGRPLGK